ncbi:hypothetical protein BKK81_22655 [Cupriavidus sp. USMAHM13]|uniref:ABC transporter permease n=1 Tax=Cupriavidus sp. USMAHM13 TaxID=1389192 RepID=UPI0008A6DB1B|nr:FtsX-like permease family protein [Cupriavidus sp. USMAHM13]AOZ02117.1 hypothetical protein BKK81_22655 [Cupriavidus sp. USMAHM13]
MTSSTFKMAWRNLRRNRKRSFIAGAGIALAMSLCMATLGIMDGLSLDLIKGTVDGEVGHIQVHHPDYLATRQVLKTVPAGADDVARLREPAQVRQVARRLYAWGYLSHGQRSGGVQLMGIEPDAERGVTTMERTLVQGRFVPGQPTPWRSARPLSAAQAALDRRLTQDAVDDAFARIEDAGRRPGSAAAARRVQETAGIAEQLAPRPERPPAAVLGSKLASNLGVSIGDRVSLLYENTLGAQSTIDLEVVGISRSGLDAVDRTRVLLQMEDLQKLLLLERQAHEIAIRIRDPREAVDVAAALGRTLAATPGAPPRSVLAWSQLRPDITALIASNQALMGTLVFIVFLVAGIGVLNTMLVSVLERQHEISLLKALGQAPRSIMSLVMLETCWLTALSCLAGLAIGYLAQAWLHVHGIDVSAFGGFSMSGVSVAPVLRASLSPVNAVIPLLCLFLINLLAAVVPAAVATRIPAAQGLSIK